VPWGGRVAEVGERSSRGGIPESWEGKVGEGGKTRWKGSEIGLAEVGSDS